MLARTVSHLYDERGAKIVSKLLGRINTDIHQDTYYTQNFANDGQRFLAWYLRNVYLRTPLQVRDDITDGADDKQIDAVIVDDEMRQVVIVQGKFYADHSVDGEPLREILSAWAQIQNLPALQENANQRLKVKLEAVSAAILDDYDVVYELVTTGTLTDAARRDLAAFQDTFSDFEHPSADIVLVDDEVLSARWNEAMARDAPKLSHTIVLEPGKYLLMEIARYKTVLAAVKLSDCLRLPGLHDQTLFRKNVRQFLGFNKVNKALKQTIAGETPHFFFFYHNGITALCEQLHINSETHQLSLRGLSVVNGAQSLNTILSASEKVKTARDAYVLFRFYEIPQRDLADKISIFTNSQSAVKPRDLRSNDKRLVVLKRAYEGMYRDGYMITKRGEERPADRDANKTVDVALLAKLLMTWHCQRPNNAYNENQLFDKHFDLLIHPDYRPVDILTLARWMQHIERRWKVGDLTLNEALLAAPAYSKFHLLFAVQACFCAANAQIDKVPTPSTTDKFLSDPDHLISVAATCFNSAFEMAVREAHEKNKIFSTQNWLKNKDSVVKVQSAVSMYMGWIGSIPGGADLKKALALPPDKFMLRWSAD